MVTETRAEQLREASRRWRANNGEASREASRRYRARPKPPPAVKPLCMDDDEMAMWSEINDGPTISRRARSDSPCRDCLVSFHAAMMAEGRCDGIPGLLGRARSDFVDLRTERRRAGWRSTGSRSVEAGMMEPRRGSIASSGVEFRGTEHPRNSAGQP